MRFLIVSCGRDCSDVLTQTLKSIEAQTVSDYEVMITDDASDDPDQRGIIRLWCEAHGPRWHHILNPTRLGTVRNQWEAITALNPSDDDVIVWLDLDGDRFAHPDVLARLADAYADGTMLTYGSYRPVPDPGTCGPATPFPDEVVKANGYRQYAASHHTLNHLRTMSGRVFKALPHETFRWANGEWYAAGADYIFMLAGLERAGGRYKCLPEVLCLYRSDNPLADNLVHPDETNRCVRDFINRFPLESLPCP